MTTVELGRFRRPLNPLMINNLRVKKSFGTCFFDVPWLVVHLGRTPAGSPPSGDDLSRLWR